MREWQTLFPSPIQATERLSVDPKCSLRVKRSPRIWQGCSLSERPLITGMVEYLANSSIVPCLKDRIMTPATYRDNTRAISRTSSPRPSCRSFGLRKMACPPSSSIPTSKETRVRVEAFSKTMPRHFPARVRRSRASPLPRFIRAALSRRRVMSWGSASLIEIKSLLIGSPPCGQSVWQGVPECRCPGGGTPGPSPRRLHPPPSSPPPRGYLQCRRRQGCGR